MQDFIEKNWEWWFDGSVARKSSKWDMKNVFETLDNWWDYDYSTLFPYASKLIIDKFWSPKSNVLWAGIEVKSNWDGSPLSYFGEYKVSLDRISYKYCGYKVTDEWVKYQMIERKPNNRVCEVNFAVTDHYLVQKSPFGYIDQKTKEDLESYHLKSGEALFILENWDSKDNNYQIVPSVSDNFDTFISKYSRSAKWDSWLRQVPWKLIFVTDLEKGGRFYVDHDIPSSVLSGKKPFTIIASKWADVVIKGNIPQNMMVITQWKIIFDAEWACNAQKNWDTKYSKAWQLVQWIFYAWSWFVSEKDMLNDNFDHIEWCNYWNLHIKWVVLWDLTNVKNKRRSELYTWFRPDDTKREIVLNGASVMVQFNSDLLSSNIPWVDEFNKLLVTQRE